MTIPSNMYSWFSNFHLDGEAAFMDGASIDQNPYLPGDEAALAWGAGWIAASNNASASYSRPLQGTPHQQA